MVLLVEAKLNSMEAPAVFKADLQLIAVDTFAEILVAEILLLLNAVWKEKDLVSISEH